jgi:methylamine--corrinoid protein Co-methyltransferase
VKKLVSKYEKQMDDAPLGKKFSECYDLGRVEPTQEYLDLYAKIKKEVQSIGMDYSRVGTGK